MRYRPTLTAVLVALAAVCLTGARAAAQQETFAESGVRYTVVPYTIYTFPTDVGNDGELSVWRVGTGFDVATPINERLGFRFSILGEYSDYDFEDVGDLLGGLGDEFEAEAYIVRISPAFMYRLDERWMLFGGPIVEFGAETGADLGDAVTYGGFGTARYRVNERFAVTFGAIAKTSLEDDLDVIPIGGVEFKFADDLVVGATGAQLGFNVRVGKKVSEQFAVSVFGGFQNREYRLDDDSLIPEGVLRDTRVPLGLELDYRPSENVVFRLAGGAVVWQETEFDDRDGNDIGDDSSDVTPFVAFSASITF